jgi:TM2 domain-containing membrane protein YozV
MEAEEQNLPRRSGSAGEQVPMRTASNTSLPPHPLDKRWFAHVDGQNYGPYTGHEIKRMVEKDQIVESDFLCAEGATAWTQAKNEPLLGALFRTRAQAAAAHTASITANGGTIVQVTNNIPTPNLAHAALLLDGAAAQKSPGVALLFSFLLCGTGQMYNRQVAKGILIIVGCIVLFSMGTVSSGFFLCYVAVWIWQLFDAYSTAKKMNLRYQQRLLAGMM